MGLLPAGERANANERKNCYNHQRPRTNPGQVLSGIFALSNVLGLVFTLAEVWAIYPNAELTPAIVTGHLLSIVARFAILTYQVIYLCWTFGTQGTVLTFRADSQFWWWQYVWVSAILLIPYLFEVSERKRASLEEDEKYIRATTKLTLFHSITSAQCVGTLFPVATSIVYSANDDYIQSFLSIFSPLSRLFVAKTAHENTTDVLKYLAFWFTLITWKLLFSYKFEVSCMVLPTMQLTDDFTNNAEVSEQSERALMKTRFLAMNQHPRNGYRYNGCIHY